MREAAEAAQVRAAAVAEPLLEVRDLRVDYAGGGGTVCAVNGVSFTIGRGEVFGLAGESGCGKSTVAQALVRILQPPAEITGGTVRFGGRDILEMSPETLRGFRWREVALVMQSASNALNPVLPIGEQIADAVRAHAADLAGAEVVGSGDLHKIAALSGRALRQASRERAALLLDRVGVGAARAASYPHQLSGGMRQRVAIAMALALDPALLILDEPTTALDVVVQREILDELAALRARLGFAILFISHDLGLMFELATRIAVLYAGEIIEEAPAAVLRRDPRHPYTQGLIRSVPLLSGPRRPLVGVPGLPADLRSPPSGCRFHPRCERAVAACRQAVPIGRRHDRDPEDHRVACHLDPGPQP
jgi:peptide/nickel transport system ATP-binding protein